MELTYSPLDLDRYETRVLTILPDPPDSSLRCTLSTLSLLDAIKYDALSYCWGNPAITTDITVDGIKTPVTINLSDALRRLRGIGVHKVWADALCISQKDKLEKSMQIRNMRLVYSRAETTYGWLGKEGAGQTISFLFSVTKKSFERL